MLKRLGLSPEVGGASNFWNLKPSKLHVHNGGCRTFNVMSADEYLRRSGRIN